MLEAAPSAAGWLSHLTEDSVHAEPRRIAWRVLPSPGAAAYTRSVAVLRTQPSGAASGVGKRTKARKFPFGPCERTLRIESLPRFVDGLLSSTQASATATSVRAGPHSRTDGVAASEAGRSTEVEDTMSATGIVPIHPRPCRSEQSFMLASQSRGDEPRALAVIGPPRGAAPP